VLGARLIASPPCASTPVTPWCLLPSQSLLPSASPAPVRRPPPGSSGSRRRPRRWRVFVAPSASSPQCCPPPTPSCFRPRSDFWTPCASPPPSQGQVRVQGQGLDKGRLPSSRRGAARPASSPTGRDRARAGTRTITRSQAASYLKTKETDITSPHPSLEELL
jgi:hypothetical protein